ncbi:MAG: glycoside hydrolase family 2 protein [Kibdelosporangium sp.]
MVTRVELRDGWTVRADGGRAVPAIAAAVVPATVPGSVHTDLLAAGLIPDPYLDDNEAALSWIGRVDWRYETAFEFEPARDARVELVCDGLDTVARIELNGQEIASTRNMHRRYRFDIGTAVRPGENLLTVRFTSALDHAEAVEQRLGARPHVNTHPYNMIRKMACNFGWDWGPDLVTAGIWRPIAIEQSTGPRIGHVRAFAGADGIADVHVGLRDPGNDPLVVTARINSHEVTATVPPGSDQISLRLQVDDAGLWWPRGYGPQTLYPLEVELSTGDKWHGRVGFRTVELNTVPDHDGTPFTLVVNGVPVFAKGVNWIPDDCFPHRVDRARYDERMTQAVEAGVNLLRVWGGGIYESDDFYDLADEKGLLVWQDFLFACAAYPEEEPLRGEIVAEARDAINRLAGHPSLVLWNGCNENIWGYHDWGWQDRLGDETWGIGYYTDILPKILAELDPSRPYVPGSPYSMSADIHPNDPAHGCAHVWDVWNDRDYAGYLDYRPRFAAEFGFCGPPARSTVDRAIHERPLAPYGRVMTLHNKADHGNRKIARALAGHFPRLAGFDDWHWAAQLNQARAIRTGVQHFRALSPLCSGTVLWQLNDCWPVTSWSTIDGDGRLKPAWYALRESYADRLLTIQGSAAALVNDTAETWSGELDLKRIAFDGTVRTAASLPFEIHARATATLPLPPSVATPDTSTGELLVAATGETRAYWYFAPDLDQALPEPSFAAEAAAVDGGYRVTVTAGTLLRDLTLLADQVAADSVVDKALLTLLPGEQVAFTVRSGARFEPDLLLHPTVLRCANQLGTDRRAAG